MLTKKQIAYLLQLLAEKHGHGYSDAEVDGVKIGVLQAALSVMGQVARR